MRKKNKERMLIEKRIEVLYNLTNVYEIFYFKEDLCI